MAKETIIIDGVRYYADRPRSCRGCFFWKNRKVGCTLKKENCYYLAESPKPKSPCAGCSYGPCVSFCMKKNGFVPSKTIGFCVPFWKKHRIIGTATGCF